MANRTSYRFNNNSSVRFNLASFALPVADAKKKNTMYTANLVNLKGTKGKLLPAPTPAATHGYTYVAYWGNWVFGGDETGIYIADKNILDFQPVSQVLNPQKLCIANNRLFSIGMNRQRLVYSVNLQSDWQPSTIMSGVIHIPEAYGLCLDIVFYRDYLLVICENGLLKVNNNLQLSYLSDDSQLFLENLQSNASQFWKSDWFTLGYATDTQTLREVFLKTNAPLTLVVESNVIKRTIRVKAADKVQKIKTNLHGDQFRIAILITGNNFCVSNLSAIVEYGERG